MKPKAVSLWPLYIAVFAVSLAITTSFPFFQNKYENNIAMVIGLAVSSVVWMLLALLIGPVSVIKTGNLPNSKWLSIRRCLGTWTALLMTVHLFCLWKYLYGFSFAKAMDHGFVSFLLLHIAVSYVIVMGITSNDFSVNIIGYKFWKRFHSGILLLFPVIALEGAYQLYRINTHWLFYAIVGSTALIIPGLQLIARNIIKRQK